MQTTLNGLFLPIVINYGQAEKDMLSKFKSNETPTDEEKDNIHAYRTRTWRKLQTDDKPILLTPDIMLDLDKIFVRCFQQEDQALDPKLLIGTYHSTYIRHLKLYQDTVISYLRETIIDKPHTGDTKIVAENIEMKLRWALRVDHPGRPPLPLYTRSAVMAVAHGLSMTPEAIKEVCMICLLYLSFIFSLIVCILGNSLGRTVG